MPPQRRAIKRCANHVYIAHMIEELLHMDRCGHYAQLISLQQTSPCALGLYVTWHVCGAFTAASCTLTSACCLCLCLTGNNATAHCLTILHMLCRMHKQQQQQRILSRLNGVDGAQADGMTNGDHVAASAAPLTERLGSGQSGGGLPSSLPKRVTPLQSSAAPQSLGLGNGLGQVAH